MSRKIIDILQDKVSEELGTGKLTKAKRMKLETLLDELSQSLPENSSFEKEYKHLLRFREYNKGYISRLLFDYAEGMELLEIFKEKILAIGNQFYQENKKNKTYKFKVLTALYDRAVLVASEVITLMQNGFASGALSRWRTLYETSVIAIFLSINEEVISERYLKYDAVERLSNARRYNEKSSALGFGKLSKRTIEKIQKEVDNLKSVFGSDFAKNYGWSKPVFPNKNPTFYDIVHKTDIDYMYPFYDLSCHYVHSGVHGVFYNIGKIYGTTGDKRFSGQSNVGFVDTAQITAFSLLHVIEAYVLLKPSLDNLVNIWFLRKMVTDIANAFMRGQEKTQQEEIQYN